jgi:small subunit ribosomal protein S17
MSEEEKTEETTEEAPEETPEETPEAAAEAPAEEAPADEPAPEAEEAPAEEPASKAPAASEEPKEAPVGPKERRRVARSTHTGETLEPRSDEQRASERVEARKRKSASRTRARAAARQRRGAERGEGTPAAEREPGNRKVRLGTVVSAKPDKTITVRVEITHRHPTYEKVVRRSNTVHAHDERNEAGEGDVVRVVETRPMSRLKRWRLVEIVEKAR